MKIYEDFDNITIGRIDAEDPVIGRVQSEEERPILVDQLSETHPEIGVEEWSSNTGVGPAQAERTDSGPSGSLGRGPRGEGCRDIETTLVRLQLGARPS